MRARRPLEESPRCRPASPLRRRGGAEFGPSRLAHEVVPLPLGSPYSVLPSAESRTEVGNQPVGMNPSGLLAPASLTFTTATSFVAEFATKSIDSSAVSASELGIEPAGAPGSMAVPIVSIGLFASRSTTVTVFRLALAI